MWRPLKRLFGLSRLEAPTDERMARAEMAIARLPDRTREVFILHRFEDLSYERIARRLGIGVDEVEAHVAASILALMRALRDTD